MFGRPNKAQIDDIDFLLQLGELFTLVAYGQLILENKEIYNVNDDLVDQIFDFMIRDFSKYALQLYCKPSSRFIQKMFFKKMLRRPVVDSNRYERVWKEQVYVLKGVYEMNK